MAKQSEKDSVFLEHDHELLDIRLSRFRRKLLPRNAENRSDRDGIISRNNGFLRTQL